MLVVTFSYLLPTAAQEATRSAILIDGPTDSSAAEFQYRKKWLVVVGINYHPEDREQKKEASAITGDAPMADDGATVGNPKDEVRKLDNAENDAMAVHQILVEKFGFENDDSPDRPSQLMGKEATQSRIRERIGQLATGAGMTDEDCVVVYFSGHGVLQREALNSPLRGFFLPVDAKVSDSHANPGTAIEMKFVVESLTSCPAKHKLLILDCCHSGAVFRLSDVNNGSDRESDENAMNRSRFIARGFQVITASRDNEKASDGRYGHSPFTNALLVSLQTTPLLVHRTADERGIFTVNRLFDTMVPYLRGDGISSQQCGWFGGDRGQLHFIPKPNAVFEAELDTPLQRNQLLAVTPTTFGNWWAEEVPWFMPGLRLAILQQIISSRSMSDELDPKSLLEAAQQAHQQAKMQSMEGDAGPNLRFAMRYRHLEMLLQANAGVKRRLAIEEIKKELEGIIEKADTERPTGSIEESAGITPDAEDYHYLAVLQHLLNDVENAEKNYTTALGMYTSLFEKNDTAGRGRFLGALCLLDAAMLSTSRHKYQEGRNQIRMALSRLGNEVPWTFKVFALCREADAYSGEGRHQLSHDRMEQAVHVLTRYDPGESTLLFANTMKSRAWGHMISWDFKNAGNDFDMAEKILNKNRESRFETCIDLFHVRHGKAMIERYQGRDKDCLSAYRTLTLDIANELALLDRKDDQEILNHSEVRSLLSGRLVNSLERQADCSLFGTFFDYAEAADDYRRAIHECRQGNQESQNDQLIDLLYRRAISICLHAVELSSDQSRTSTVVQEFDLAQEICNEADELSTEVISKRISSDLAFKTKAVKHLALVCLKLRPDKTEPLIEPEAGAAFSIDFGEINGPSEKTFDLKSLLSDLSREPNSCDRDELERLMFFHKTLIEYRDRFHIPPYESLKHVNQLLAFCRSACRLENPDPDLLAYLRQYYDSAFTAQLELLPAHTKELVEISYEATHGKPYLKPGIIQPMLAIYVSRGKCHVLIDARGSASQTLMLDDIFSTEDLIVASNSESDQLPFPDQVRRILRLVERHRDHSRIELRWRDPVLGIGVEPRSPAGTGLVATARPDLGSGPKIALENPDPKFPLILAGISRLEPIDDRNPLCVDLNTDGPAKMDSELQPASLPEVIQENEAETATH